MGSELRNDHGTKPEKQPRPFNLIG